MRQYSYTNEFAFELELCTAGGVPITVEIVVDFGVRYGARVWEISKVLFNDDEVPESLYLTMIMGGRNLKSTDDASQWLDEEITWRLADYV